MSENFRRLKEARAERKRMEAAVSSEPRMTEAEQNRRLRTAIAEIRNAVRGVDATGITDAERTARAEAWDEGYHQCLRDAGIGHYEVGLEKDEGADNPYRTRKGER